MLQTNSKLMEFAGSPPTFSKFDCGKPLGLVLRRGSPTFLLIAILMNVHLNKSTLQSADS